MKLFKIVVVLFLFCVSAVSSQAQTTSIFLSQYQQTIKELLSNYKQNRGEELDAQIFDISNRSFYGFLEGSKGKRKYENDLMAMMYFDNIKINNKSSSFCFILYNPQSMLIENYIKNTNFGIDDTILYLALHEMAHCFIRHQQQLSKITDKLTPQEDEQFADMFSIAYFIMQNQKLNAAKIVRQNKKLNEKDVHYSPEQLEKFFILFNEQEIETQNSNNIQYIINNTYNIFKKIKNNLE